MEEIRALFGTEPFFENVSMGNVAVNLLLSAILGAFLALVYRWNNRTAPDKRVFMVSLVLLSMAIAAAMTVIGNNVARAFGLVGAVSIVRFRTSVRNSKDMAFVFLAIVIGMACGLQFRLMAVLLTAVASGVACLLSAVGFGSRGETHRQYLLKVDVRGMDVPLNRIEGFLKDAAVPWELSERSITGSRSTAKYLLTLRADADPAPWLRSLQAALDAEDARAAVTLKSQEPRW